jgi:hypothetical protein
VKARFPKNADGTMVDSTTFIGFIGFAPGILVACSVGILISTQRLRKSICEGRAGRLEHEKQKADVYEEFAKHVTLVHNEEGTLVAVTLTDEEHVIQRVLWEKR